MNKWYCLTITWKSGEVQSVWSIDWELIRQLRVFFRGHEDAVSVYLSRNGKPKEV